MRAVTVRRKRGRCERHHRDERTEPGYQSDLRHLHTGFYFHNHWLSVFIPHLSDIQQIVRIAIMPGPAVDKYPRPTATTVYHDAIVHIGVIGVCSFNVSNSGPVPCLEKQMHTFIETEKIILNLTEQIQQTNTTSVISKLCSSTATTFLQMSSD